MHKEIAGNTGTIFPVIAPPEKAFFIPCILLVCELLVSFPINRLWRCVQWYGIFPCTQCTLPVKHSFHRIYFTNITSLIHFLCLCIYDAADALAAHLQYFFCFLLCMYHIPSLLNLV